MKPANQNNSTDFIETLLTSFEDRIQKIENVFSTSESVTESSHALMDDFQYSLRQLKKERTQLNTMLRENLAKSGSLRKNDYDCLMGELFLLLDEKEKEAKNEFYRYIEDQKAMISLLRQGILEIKNIGQNDNKEKIENFKLELETILKAQQHRKEHAIAKFLEFQNIHKKITHNFQALLDQDAPVFCKDIKNVKKHILEEII